MKITAAKSNAFVRNVPDSMRAVLLYGPDAGLVRDHAAAIISSIVGAPADTFRLTVMHPDAISDGAGALVDEINALSLGGGRRVVNLRSAIDSCAPACSAALELGRGDTLLVVEAADLPARSKLRAVFEKPANAGALPCYPASSQSISALAQSVFADHKVTASPEVYDTITRHLGADHLVSRRELEKLATYGLSAGRLEPDDVVVNLADVAALSLDDIVNAVADGQLDALDSKLRQLFEEKVTGVAIVRAVGRHIQRLWQVQAAISAGQSLDSAMSRLRPPVFWKFKESFSRQVQRWPSSRLTAASQRLLEAELALKSTHSPERPITERCLLSIAGLAKRR